MNLYASENLNFVHSSLLLLHSYKTYIVNDYRCDHFNQWLVLDSSNRPHCECKHGKSCNTENNYKTIIIIITIVFMVLLLIWIISLFTNTAKLIKMLDATRLLLNKNRAVQQ